jgi:hypothetical protein
MKVKYTGSKFDYTYPGIDRALVPGETVEVEDELGTLLISTGIFASCEPVTTHPEIEITVEDF